MNDPSEAAAREDIDERSLMRKVFWRTIPFILCCYVASYLDRVNVGFAAIQMNKDLHLSPSIFGLGAGLFFIGYFACEIPSNLMLLRFGPRRWISRIMVTWGAICVLTAFANGGWSFSIARLLLGMAEAGFTPGVFLFFTFWFPGPWRAQATAAFLVGIPLANMLGAPLSGLILNLDGLMGARGWQWLFILEGAPAILLGLACLLFVVDRPGKAEWLSAPEKAWLTARIEGESQQLAERHGGRLRDAFSLRVLLYSAANFCGIVGSLGIGIWLPLIVKRFGLSNVGTGMVTALPYAVGAVAMILWARLARNSGRRRVYVVAPLVAAAAGLAVSGLASTAAASIMALVVAVTGILCFQATFWGIPSSFLTGRAAAAGLALIASIGNLGGFVGPFGVGFLRQRTGSFTSPLFFMAGVLLVAAIVMIVVGDGAGRAASASSPTDGNGAAA